MDKLTPLQLGFATLIVCGVGSLVGSALGDTYQWAYVAIVLLGILLVAGSNGTSQVADFVQQLTALRQSTLGR